MAKTGWEARVGILLDPRFHSSFKYSYKPYDSAAYGGQPRIDWHAADEMGRYWLIEVKSLAAGRKTFSMHDITPGQRQGLDGLADTALGVPLLAVGQDTTLYIFDWRRIRWLYDGSPKSPLLPLTECSWKIPWTGPKSWQMYDLVEAANITGILHPSAAWTTGFPTIAPMMGPMPGPGSGVPLLPPGFGIPPMPDGCDPCSCSTPAPPSPSISKPEGSTRTRRKKLLSALSSQK